VAKTSPLVKSGWTTVNVDGLARKAKPLIWQEEIQTKPLKMVNISG